MDLSDCNEHNRELTKTHCLALIKDIGLTGIVFVVARFSSSDVTSIHFEFETYIRKLTLTQMSGKDVERCNWEEGNVMMAPQNRNEYFAGLFGIHKK